MEIAVSAARWVVGKALGPVKDGVLEAWAASAGLGPNVDALKLELLGAQGMLDNAQGREIRSPALKELLLMLRQLAYDADDVLDELEYFRIQDALDGTFHAAIARDGGCVDGLVLNARHTARAVAAKFKLSSCSRKDSRADPDDDEDDAKQGCLSGIICSCGGRAMRSTPRSPSIQSDQNGGCMSKVASSARRAAHTVGKHLPCCSFPCVHNNAQSAVGTREDFCSACQSKIKEGKHVVQAPKLKFDRVEMSKKMKDIVEKLKPVTTKVSTILDMELLGSAILKLEVLRSNTTSQKDAMDDRPKTTPDIIEPKLYGRDNQKMSLIDGITNGQYFSNNLVVLPIVGPGGIGKTTFTQYVYDEVKKHFEVSIWICVSLNFNVSRLAQEAVRKIPKVDNERENSSAQELIEQRLKNKRFLLVLDDMWKTQEDEWKKLLAPFRRGGEKGNVVIVTTRIPEVAEMVKTVDCSVQMDRLGVEDFMHFFEACVFGYQQPWKDHLELRDVGEKIVNNLKGFPLAAKTVGRLLRKQLTLDHWTRVLESKEWELQTNDNDIMPALKLSYDYLPFHLQQCFSHCSLFPEDYEFCSDELVHFWIGLDILNSCGQNKRAEDIAGSYLVDLVNHGFLKRNEKDDGTPYYVVHDLLHDLAVKVSSYQCISIYSSNVRSIEIPISVRHLSIVVDDKEVENRVNFENFKRELRELDKRLNVENLRTLMLFGSHHGSYAKIFGHLFREARAIRTIYLSGASYNVEDMLYNFSKLFHLRYLRIKSSGYNNDICLPAALSRLYHLEVIDLQEWRGCFGFTRHLCNLVKLRHFLVPEHKLQLHSGIVEVGKMKLLQELRHFEVGKESKGFELSQLGQLSGLGGSLAICNLERMQTTKEADEAILTHIKRLHRLTLEWDADRPEKDTATEENALEVLMPHSYLQDLCIRGHGGIKCPQWLGEKLLVKNLESLHLDGVAWNTFPPIGELWLVNGPNEEISSNICDKKFQNLRRLELVKLPRLKNWVVDAPCQLFADLEVLVIKDCPKLTKLSFAHSTCCQQERDKEANMNWFPSLRELKIKNCPELSSFPPVPWTSAPCCARISGIASGLDNLVCRKNYKSEYVLEIRGAIDLDSTFWNMLAFGNLGELERLEVSKCPPLPLHHLRMLSSLKTLQLHDSGSIVFPLIEGESRAEYQFPIECMTIYEWGASPKELTQLLNCLPKLSELGVSRCEKITGLGVVEKQATATPADAAQIQQQDGTRGEEEIAAEAEGLLLLPSQLQQLRIYNCPELILLRSDPVDYNREAGRTAGGQGLQGLTSLRSFSIDGCPRFLSSYSSSSSSPCFPFPTSLEELSLRAVEGMETLLPLSNLTSLTDLSMSNCGDLRGEGLRPLIAQGRLTALTVHRTPNFFAGSESSPPHEQEFPSSSSKLQVLGTDDVAGVLAAPICTFLSASLTELHFDEDKEVERFTKKQEEALQLLTSLEWIGFWYCDKLQCLPAALRTLPNLKRLRIDTCEAIRSLPKDGLPGSLQELVIKHCPGMRWIHKECLPNSLQKLEIRRCPTIRSLPKVDDLPSSLQELGVCYGNSEELRRQCRKFIGTIPIVRI